MCNFEVDNTSRVDLFECNRYKEGSKLVIRTAWLTNEDYETVVYLADSTVEVFGTYTQVANKDYHNSYSFYKLRDLQKALLKQYKKGHRCYEGVVFRTPIFTEPVDED